MDARHCSSCPERGAALFIVLAFLVLLTFLVVAYFSRTTSERQITHVSFNQTKVDQVGASAVDLIIGGLRQEITGPSPTPTPPYLPATNANMLPLRSGNPGGSPDPIPNLVRRSVRADPIAAPGISSFASAVNSTSDISANGRFITSSRWNGHYLVPKKNIATNDSIPIDAFSNATPDWVLLTRAGPVAFAAWNPTLTDATSSNGNYCVGRYAYAIYDEGGLLDANVAGYPTGTTATQVGRKGPVAFADLTALLSPIPQNQVDGIVGWRNYGSVQATTAFGTFPNFNFTAAFATNYVINFVLSNSTGFLRANGVAAANGRTDQIFLSRQQLIAFQKTTGFSANALQYLGTFFRELNAPSWKPSTPTAINPDLLNLRVTITFTRFDGTSAAVGDLLIKQRFPLSRLAWITYKGPSATLQIGKDVDPTLTTPKTSDPIILALVANGVNLQTIRAGTAANVKTCFGLVWDQRTPITSTLGAQWVYTSPSSLNSGGNFNGTSGSAATVVKTLSTVQSEAREPDFFELLKAAPLNGSFGVGSGPGDTFVLHEGKYYDTTNGLSADNQIIQIGANIIDQADPDAIPTLISFGTNLYATAGIENLPYLNKLVFKPYWTLKSGKYHFDAWLLPSLWNPHQNAPASSQSIQIAMTTGTLSATTENPPLTMTRVTGGPSEDMTVNANAWGTVVDPSVNNPSAPTATPSGLPADITKSPEGYWGFHVNNSGADTSTAPAGSTTAYPKFPTACDFQLLVDVTGSGNWKPYQTWKGCNQPATPLKCQNSGWTTSNWTATNIQDPEFVSIDPRTVRFGVWGNAGFQSAIATDYTTGVTTTLDQSVSPPTPPTTGVFEKITALPPNGTRFSGLSTPPYSLYLYANNADTTVHYTDLDAVQRGGDLVASGITAMQPVDWVDRPQILNRPFQSVAELGQVFRDQPWKTLDFTTASSPDVGLLDVFTLHESSMEAGKTSFNTRQTPVLTAILSQVTKRLNGAGIINSSTDTSDLNNIVNALVALQPLVRKTDLLAGLAGNATVIGLGNKEARELVMRAFSDAGQTRTWNLLIDVIAQSGRYPPNAASGPNTTNLLANFMVEGEQHYWVHVAIDRFTGQVIDKQIEVVNE